MTDTLSTKIRFFSFWLMVLVVLVHADMFSPDQPEAAWLANYLSRGLSWIAVPMFFAISGYLFFFSMNVQHASNGEVLKSKMRKRVSSLVIPYVLWCILWFGVLYSVQLIPALAPFFNTPLHSLSWTEQAKQLFVYPLNYPFWFLRELILYVAISPLLFWLLRRFNIWVVVVALLLSLFVKSYATVGVRIFQALPLACFLIGAYLGLYKNAFRFNLRVRSVIVLLLGWLLANLGVLFLPQDHVSFLPLLAVKALLGGIGLWYLYDIVYSKRPPKIYSWYGYSFFVYAFHGIPVLLITSFLARYTGDNFVKTHIAYFAAFIITMLLSLGVAFSTKKMLPKGYNILTGNRG